MLRNKYVLTLLGGAAAASMAIAGTGVASATTTHQAAFGRSAVAVATVPNATISGKGKKAAYKPSSISITWSGPKEKACTKKVEGFTITNGTKAAQTVTLGGTTFVTISAGKSEGVCAWGSGTTTAVFGLKSAKKAKLTVHVS
jgi:hypothetical protein